MKKKVDVQKKKEKKKGATQGPVHKYLCRICTKCDNISIGDEYHCIMECEHFSNFRNRFIVTNLPERPNILKFKQIMSAYQKQNLENFCKFI